MLILTVLSRLQMSSLDWQVSATVPFILSQGKVRLPVDSDCAVVAADVELGLASRSDLLQILNHTVHGGKSVLGNDSQGDHDSSRRLDRSLFPVGPTSLGQIPSLSPPTTASDSPGGLFRTGSSSSPDGLMSSPSALFPVSLERATSSASVDFALADETNSDPSVGGGNIFVMTDTAHDDDPSVHGARRADPPPPSQPQQAQQQLTQQLLQEQQQDNEYQLQPPAQQGPPPRRKLYAYGIADPEYMSLPCKMSMKHARVTVNHETNNRLYGKKLPGQVRHLVMSPFAVSSVLAYLACLSLHSDLKQACCSVCALVSKRCRRLAVLVIRVDASP